MTGDARTLLALRPARHDALLSVEDQRDAGPGPEDAVLRRREVQDRFDGVRDEGERGDGSEPGVFAGPGGFEGEGVQGVVAWEWGLVS